MYVLYWEKVDATPCIIFNLLGVLASAATAYIYKFEHRVEDIEERCIFHLSISLATAQFVIFINTFSMGLHYYDLKFREAPAQMAATFALSSFLWSLILVNHLRKKFTPRLHEILTDTKSISNDAELMKKYLLFGYGPPFLCFFTYLAGLDDKGRSTVAFITIIVDAAIIVVNSLMLFKLSKDLLRQIENYQLLLTTNEPVKVDIKQAIYRRQFTHRLFKTLALPWLLLWIVFIVLSPIATDDVLKGVILVTTTSVVGLQGICVFRNMVLHRKRIWKDLENEYGLKKPEKLKKLDKKLGYISEDDDDEEVINSKMRWDVLAKVQNVTQKIATKIEANLHNPTVDCERGTPQQPEVHQVVGVDNTDPTKKLMHETV